MAQYKNFNIGTSTIGSPFNGAASGTSVTISSTVMHGSTTISGAVRLGKGHQDYTPIDKRWFLLPYTDRTVKISFLSFPTLPVPVPFVPHLRQQPIRIVNYVTFTSSSFSPPTISSTVMNMSTSEIGSLNRLNIETPCIDNTNFVRLIANTWQELQVFGMINHTLYMDY